MKKTETKKDLAAKCKENGLAYSGTIAQLKERLKTLEKPNSKAPKSREEIKKVVVKKASNLCKSLTVKQANLMISNKNNPEVIDVESKHKTIVEFVKGFRHQEKIANVIAKQTDLDMVTANHKSVTFAINEEIVARHIENKKWIAQYFDHLKYCKEIYDNAIDHFTIDDVIGFNEESKKCSITGKVGTGVLKKAGVEPEKIAVIRAKMTVKTFESHEKAVEFVKGYVPAKDTY